MSESDASSTSILIPSPYTDNAEFFDKEACYPDVEIVIKGQEKPLHLHRLLLGRASKVLDALFKCKQSVFGKYNDETRHVEWLFDTERDETYRKALVKWLQLCYGMNVSFETCECAAALSALVHLQLTEKESIQDCLVNGMLEQAVKNIDCGIEMLRSCVDEYEECHCDETDNVNLKLAKVVFRKQHLEGRNKGIVENLLMSLPVAYLNCVEYGEEHSEQSKLNIRLKYIEKHKDMTEDEKREVVGVIERTKLNSGEARKLVDMKLMSIEELFDLVYKMEKDKVILEEERESMLKRKTIIQCFMGVSFNAFFFNSQLSYGSHEGHRIFMLRQNTSEGSQCLQS